MRAAVRIGVGHATAGDAGHLAALHGPRHRTIHRVGIEWHRVATLVIDLDAHAVQRLAQALHDAAALTRVTLHGVLERLGAKGRLVTRTIRGDLALEVLVDGATELGALVVALVQVDRVLDQSRQSRCTLSLGDAIGLLPGLASVFQASPSCLDPCLVGTGAQVLGLSHDVPGWARRCLLRELLADDRLLGLSRRGLVAEAGFTHEAPVGVAPDFLVLGTEIRRSEVLGVAGLVQRSESVLLAAPTSIGSSTHSTIASDVFTDTGRFAMRRRCRVSVNETLDAVLDLGAHALVVGSLQCSLENCASDLWIVEGAGPTNVTDDPYWRALVVQVGG